MNPPPPPTYSKDSWYIRLAFGLRPEKPKRANRCSIALGCLDSIIYYAALNFFSVVGGILMILVWGGILLAIIILAGKTLFSFAVDHPLQALHTCIGVSLVALMAWAYTKSLHKKGTTVSKQWRKRRTQIHSALSKCKERICPTRDIV